MSLLGLLDLFDVLSLLDLLYILNDLLTVLISLSIRPEIPKRLKTPKDSKNTEKPIHTPQT